MLEWLLQPKSYSGGPRKKKSTYVLGALGVGGAAVAVVEVASRRTCATSDQNHSVTLVHTAGRRLATWGSERERRIMDRQRKVRWQHKKC